MDRWYGNSERRRSVVTLADAMYGAGAGNVAALPDVANIAVDRSRGALIRASAAEFVGQLVTEAQKSGQTSPSILNALLGAAADPEPMVRITAVRALGLMPLMNGQRTLSALAARLGDSARAVRVSAAEAMMNLGVSQLNGELGPALTRAQDEWADSLRTFNDVAHDHVSLGWLEASRGRADQASEELRNAIALNPRDPQPHVYLGVIAARAGKFDDALQEFKAAKNLDPSYHNLDRLIDEARKRATSR
jgi:tetratricopeptide (TPR) repeat protein